MQISTCSYELNEWKQQKCFFKFHAPQNMIIKNPIKCVFLVLLEADFIGGHEFNSQIFLT